MQEPVLRAISFAARAHDGQRRKDGATPYAAHPCRVLFILRSVFGVEDADTLTAAALHDTIEDTTVDRDDVIEEFGERVASFVALLSKDKRLPEKEREDRYFEQLASAPIEVRLCKLGDTLDNLIDGASLKPSARAKGVRTARRVLDVLGPDWPTEWIEVFRTVEAEVTRLEN
ncbi:MAG: HD domain-containing protein [Planctomycetota bacterium]